VPTARSRRKGELGLGIGEKKWIKRRGNSLAWSGGRSTSPATDQERGSDYETSNPSRTPAIDRERERRGGDLPAAQTGSDKKKKRGRRQE
jgi:hypothetical protein